MFQSNATKYFESQNINISNLNLTNDNINDFIKKLLQLSMPVNVSDTVHGGLEDFNGENTKTCQHYCKGHIRDTLLCYKSIHGYISLVVSAFSVLHMF